MKKASEKSPVKKTNKTPKAALRDESAYRFEILLEDIQSQFKLLVERLDTLYDQLNRKIDAGFASVNARLDHLNGVYLKEKRMLPQ